MTDRIYAGWDVHSYTPQMREMLGETHLFDRLVQKYLPRWSCRNPFSDDAFFSCCDSAMKMSGSSPGAQKCLEKFKFYWNSTDGGWKDPDLGDVNVAWLFCCAVKAAEAPGEPSVKALFRETLEDIGTTCIQGDSHRLVFFLFGLLG